MVSPLVQPTTLLSFQIAQTRAASWPFDFKLLFMMNELQTSPFYYDGRRLSIQQLKEQVSLLTKWLT